MADYQTSRRISDEAKRLALLGNLADRVIKPILENLSLTIPAKTILDLGCGTGEAFPLLREVFPQARIIGIDFNEKTLDIAANKSIADKLIREDLRFISTNLDLQDYLPADLIFIRNVLIHIPKVQPVLMECHKCMREDGVIVLEEADYEPAEGDFPEFDIFKNSMINMMKTNQIDPFIGQKLVPLLSTTGWRNIQTETETFNIKTEDDEWEILELLIEVAGDRIIPHLNAAGVNSVSDMKQILNDVRKKPNNFTTPAWIVAYGYK